jgi:hypothetical protein
MSKRPSKEELLQHFRDFFTVLEDADLDNLAFFTFAYGIKAGPEDKKRLDTQIITGGDPMSLARGFDAIITTSMEESPAIGLAMLALAEDKVGDNKLQRTVDKRVSSNMGDFAKLANEIREHQKLDGDSPMLSHLEPEIASRLADTLDALKEAMPPTGDIAPKVDEAIDKLRTIAKMKGDGTPPNNTRH